MEFKKRSDLIDIAIRGVFFFAFPAVWISGFAGIKYLCHQVCSGQPLEMNSFVITLILLLAFTVIFGRFFCGKACAFGTYGDVVYCLAAMISKKTGRKLPKIPDSAAEKMRCFKYIVLLVICILCIAGYSAEVTGGSPWTTFSYLTSLKFDFNSTLDILSLALFIACSAGMMTARRFFCRFLCPFGAVFSLMPVMPFSMVRRRKSKCIKGCRACGNICPAGLDLPYIKEADEEADENSDDKETEAGYQFKMGECFQCGKCTHICPKSNAGSPTMPGRTAGIAADIFKAAILAGLLWYII